MSEDPGKTIFPYGSWRMHTLEEIPIHYLRSEVHNIKSPALRAKVQDFLAGDTTLEEIHKRSQVNQ